MVDLIPVERIERRIYLIRGKKVILDKDLAELYEVKAIRLREQVKRNVKRFPPDFMFQLNKNEVDLLVSQNAIPSKRVLGGYLPYVFSEHGALMLSSVLNSKMAVKVGIQIVRAFIKMREILSSQKKLKEKIGALERKYDLRFKVVFDAIKALVTIPEIKKINIGFLKDRDK